MPQDFFDSLACGPPSTLTNYKLQKKSTKQLNKNKIKIKKRGGGRASATGLFLIALPVAPLPPSQKKTKKKKQNKTTLKKERKELYILVFFNFVTPLLVFLHLVLGSYFHIFFLFSVVCFFFIYFSVFIPISYISCVCTCQRCNNKLFIIKVMVVHIAACKKSHYAMSHIYHSSYHPN